MEGVVARWYPGIRGYQEPDRGVPEKAGRTRLTNRLPEGAKVLEVAFGPGYLAIELARLGRHSR